MLKNTKSYKKTQAVKPNSNNIEPEQKKTKSEDVARQFGCQNFVKFTMNNSLKQVDQKKLNKFRKYSELGKKLIFFVSLLTFYVYLYAV